MIGLHLYECLFKVIPFDAKNQLKESFNIRFVLFLLTSSPSLIFLPSIPTSHLTFLAD